MSTPRALHSAVKAPKGKHTATCIFLHGLGDSSAGWDFLAEQFASSLPHIKWIFPNAPYQSVTVNSGMQMPAWYDLYGLGDDPSSLSKPRKEDETGLLQSVTDINAIIDKELAAHPEVPIERFVVGGFSQGSVVSLATGITSKRNLAGVVGLSGYVALASKIPSLASDLVKQLNIFWGHGKADPIVKYSWAEQGREVLTQLGVTNLEFHAYEGLAHSANIEELKHLEAWLSKTVPQDA